MQKLAEIGSDRLVNVLVKDKNINPQKTLSILKSEITSLLESYLELDDEIEINQDIPEDEEEENKDSKYDSEEFGLYKKYLD